MTESVSMFQTKYLLDGQRASENPSPPTPLDITGPEIGSGVKNTVDFPMQSQSSGDSGFGAP